MSPHALAAATELLSACLGDGNMPTLKRIMEVSPHRPPCRTQTGSCLALDLQNSRNLPGPAAQNGHPF